VVETVFLVPAVKKIYTLNYSRKKPKMVIVLIKYHTRKKLGKNNFFYLVK
jgi:hypothetical protein